MAFLSFIVSFLIYILLALPICHVLHELGHAGMILLFTKQKVTFQFGMRGTKREIHSERLTIIIYFEPGALFSAIYRLENKSALSKLQDFWITIGGPVASLMLTILCSVLWLAFHRVDPWRGLAIINLVVFLNSSLPRHYDKWQGVQSGIPNDGLQLVQLIRQARYRNGDSRG